MAEQEPRRTWLSGPMELFGKTRVGGWLILKVMTPIDDALLKLSRGRFSLVAPGFPTLLLTSTGARSGQPRTVPLVYVRDGPAYVVIASAAGQERHPGWYYNLRANPACAITVDGKEIACTARQAEGDERERLWGRATRLYTGYGTYQSRASHRTIAIFVLTPAA